MELTTRAGRAKLAVLAHCYEVHLYYAMKAPILAESISADDLASPHFASVFVFFQTSNIAGIALRAPLNIRV